MVLFDIDQNFLKWGARVGTDNDRYFVLSGRRVECGGFEKLTEYSWFGYGFRYSIFVITFVKYLKLTLNLLNIFGKFRVFSY